MTETWATERLEQWRAHFKTIDRTTPPDGVPINRWRRFLNDCASFIHNGRCLQAIEMGWDEYQLFAFDNQAPLARVDHLGVLWFVQGAKILDVTPNRIEMAVKSGSLSSRPREIDPRFVRLPWEAQEEQSSERAGTPLDGLEAREAIGEPGELSASVAPPDGLSELLGEPPSQDRGMEPPRRSHI
jgi:hypothetical protein